MIEQLPTLTPDPDRAERTIVRCHRQLALMEKPASPKRGPIDARRRARYALERNALLGFGAIYLSSLAFVAVQVLIAH